MITGYPDSEILDRILQFGPVTVLKKPLYDRRADEISFSEIERVGI